MFALEIFQTAFSGFFKLILSFLRLLDRNSQHGVVIQTTHEPPSSSKQCNFGEFPNLALRLCSCGVYLQVFFNELVCSHEVRKAPEQFGNLQALQCTCFFSPVC